MNRKLLGGLAVVVVLVVAATVWAFRPTGTTEVSEKQALEDFRDRDSTTEPPNTQPQNTKPATSSTEAANDGAIGTPPAGVYTYRASGREVVKLGPFPEETRQLPETLTGVVVSGEQGCHEFTLNLFAEHVEDSTFCVRDGALSVTQYAKHQKIGPTSPTVNITCDPGVIHAPDTDTRDLVCTLELAGGPLPVKADFEGTATSAAPETLTIAGRSVEVAPVSITYDIVGSVSGTWTEKLWLTDSNLIVRLERTLDLNGPASFDEQFELELTSLTPST